MTVRRRNHVQVSGAGPVTLFFGHGFGCDQTVWRFVEPAYASRFRTVKFDLVGMGESDLAAYDAEKYSTLQGHADDVLEIVKEFGQGPAIFVGHSVGAMIGMLADLKEPGHIAAHVMVGPSPCYINEGDYQGGFERKDIESLLQTMDSNYLAWASTMAPAIMGTPDRPELGVELASSFCRMDPDIAKQFARVTFLADNRADLPRLKVPALVLQCSDDPIAPLTVGHYMRQALTQGRLKIIQNVGHCPHLSAPGDIIDAMDVFLAEEGLETLGASDAGAAGAASDAGLLALLDDAACGLAQTDANGMLRRVNLVFCSWLGYSREELVGKRKLQDLLTTGSRVFYQTHALPLLLMQGSVSEVRLEGKRKDGTVLPMMLNALRHEKQGVVVHEVAVLVAQDRDRYEQELIRSRQQLQAMVEQATQLQAQAKERALFAEQMVGIVSHDLRNPLMVILMSAETLGKSGVTPGQSNAVARILKAAERANRLVTDLLDLTQAQLGSGLAVWPTCIDLHATVAEAVAELGQAFPNQALHHVQQGLGPCTADADRLVQLVGNLVANAMAYGAPGTPVVVTSAIMQDTFSILVENQGNPIPGHMMQGLFKLMVHGSGDASHARSIGLGLFIVSEIAKAHGGTAQAVSTPEGHTIFTVVFPRNPSPAGGEPD